MADYPDWTDLVHIVGTDIMVAVDLQGAYIMMPVDIQAQYVTLNIDITAQSVGNIAIDIKAQTVGNIAVSIAASAVTLNVAIASSAVTLNVNLAASAITLNVAIASSAVTLNVDITAQTIGNLTIDLKAQSVGVYLQPDWQVSAGTDKNLMGYASCADGATTKILDVAVTDGKTFYICQWGFNVAANTPIRAILLFLHVATETYLAFSGGYNGGAQSFTKPVAVVAGDKIRVYATQYSGGAVNCFGSVGGYEI